MKENCNFSERKKCSLGFPVRQNDRYPDDSPIRLSNESQTTTDRTRCRQVISRTIRSLRSGIPSRLIGEIELIQSSPQIRGQNLLSHSEPQSWVNTGALGASERVVILLWVQKLPLTETAYHFSRDEFVIFSHSRSKFGREIGMNTERRQSQ